MRPLGLSPGPFAEQLRRAHCAHADAEHPGHVCIGRCTITREGVTLDCTACGSGGESLAPRPREAEDARAVVEAAGLQWSALSPEAQRAAVSALDRSRPRYGAKP